ncbi:hypothetical protein GCM10011376_20820 [Nocardioides flavus (ex Wang et al. 2016)]|uniref:Lysoplasmalogenase n=1 Tax=Nocardioides flavus (ex Wang et al. 2016) TaxID=2058780 RepID=A0ABQ3HIH8_9ACTN|nr:lysoplasmalogenase [Nocardioides flavus (ex Wang et al. 2016)]GHE17472.1 hypothetical protein GCM10011376_20820 [Nocardioides flavus (ex Wang et al. 2016)]
MTRFRSLLPATYVGLAVVDSLAAGRRSAAARRLRYVTKPLLMPTLAATSGRGGDRTVLATSTRAAQAFSWGGDVALLSTGERAFLSGVGSFFGAHVAYVAAFSSVRGPRDDWDTTGLGVTLGLWLTAAPVMGVAAGREDPALRAPVAAYATILSAMFASSHVLSRSLPAGSRRCIRAGTALFVVSDFVLATQRFLLREPRPALDSFVMATYTAGQGLIAAGVSGATQP